MIATHISYTSIIYCNYYLKIKFVRLFNLQEWVTLSPKKRKKQPPLLLKKWLTQNQRSQRPMIRNKIINRRRTKMAKLLKRMKSEYKPRVRSRTTLGTHSVFSTRLITVVWASEPLEMQLWRHSFLLNSSKEELATFTSVTKFTPWRSNL